MILALLLVFGANRLAGVSERADLVELNHQPTFSQAIVWRWSEDYRRFHVVAWWLVDDLRQAPTAGFRGYRIEGKQNRYTAPMMRETWTEPDPERANEKLFPQEYRR